MNLLKFIFILSVLCLFSISACKKDDTPSPEVFENGPMYNLRYCEIILGTIDINAGIINADVYGTLAGCSDCPQALWDSLDATTIADEQNVDIALLNGPRYTVVDSATGTTFSPVCSENFGGIDMRWLASISISIAASAGYVPGEVARDNIWYFYKGTRVYTLEDPDGKCYIMQAYSQIIDATLQIEDLENLGTRLMLPDGWSFKTLVLEEDLNVSTTDGSTMVVQDDLRNTYQILPDGCL